jgi:hypothetical protein
VRRIESTEVGDAVCRMTRSKAEFPLLHGRTKFKSTIQYLGAQVEAKMESCEQTENFDAIWVVQRLSLCRVSGNKQPFSR